MARPLRVCFEGALYHVVFRGNERRILFRDDPDRARFRDQLAESAVRYRIRLHLVCLMPNHVHLLVGTPDANLSAFMGRLLTAYVVYFNRRHRRCGHLTQGRFKAQLVQGDQYLLKLSRYIHLNPVCGRRWKDTSVPDRLKALREYRWSTFRSYAGWETPWTGVELAPLLALVAPDESRSTERYQDFVESGLFREDPEFAEAYRSSRLSIGSGGFNATVEARHFDAQEQHRRREDVSFHRPSGLVTGQNVLDVVARVLRTEVGEFRRRRRDSILRPAACWALQRFAGLTQREVADQLEMGTGAAVSQQTARWHRLVATDAQARGMAAGIESKLVAGRA